MFCNFRYDRTADITSRVKISQEMAQAINDELYEYEDELWDPSDDEAWVSRISLLIFPLSPLTFYWNLNQHLLRLSFYPISGVFLMISEFQVNPILHPIRLQTRFLFRSRLEVETNKLTSTSCPEKILNV